MLDNHFVPDGYGIMPYFNIFGREIPSYSLFVGIALIVGILWSTFTVSFGKKVRLDKAYIIVLFALVFGLLGSKIVVIIENIGVLIDDFSRAKDFLFAGKSIIGGLAGGYVGVMVAKKVLKNDNIRIGNNIAPAIALSMAIGRIGCFLTGCCYGIETNLPIGVDFGDGVSRIPTQLIEMIFCFILFIYLFYKQQTKKELMPGILFKELVIYYFVFRFLIEFLRVTEKNILFLSIYQIISILGIIYMIFKIKREKKYG